jgi:molybdopterin-guanine dinucleotide biosynthesis protein
MNPKAMCLVAWSGTGKTTLVEKVILELKSRGHKMGAIKFDSHGFDIDKPGKGLLPYGRCRSCYRLASGEKLAMIKRHMLFHP